MQFAELQKQMIAAMKAKDKVRKEAISSLVSAAKKVAIDEGCRDDISEEIVGRVILKEMKTVKEQIDSCPDSREDLKAEYQARYDIIAEFAPQMMSAEEVESYMVDQVILKELKTVKEQIDTCPAAREDLKAEYQFRYDVISKYAPQQLSPEEVKKVIEEKFADVVATKNKGAIMKAVMGDLKGKADGKVINATVKKLCQ